MSGIPNSLPFISFSKITENENLIEFNDVIRPFPRELPPKDESLLRDEANRVERSERSGEVFLWAH
jgi:hypothetical protein